MNVIVRHIIEDLKSIDIFSEVRKTQGLLQHFDRWVGGEFSRRGYKYGIFIDIEDSSEFFIVLPDKSIATVSCDMCANAWEIICEQNGCSELFNTQIYKMGEIVEDENYSIQFMEYEVFSRIIEIIRKSCGGNGGAMGFNEGKMNNLKRLISESVKKTINGMIKEGTFPYNDGMYQYMGTGSPESKERMKKIGQKRKYTAFHDIENREKALSYDFYKTNVYNTVRNYTLQASDILKELQTKLENVKGHNSVKKSLNELIDNLTSFSARHHLKGEFKRDILGEPISTYNDEE